MKQLLSLICLCAVFSCGQQQEPIESKPGTKNSKYDKLFAYFYNIGIDTLDVSSPADQNSLFNGKEIDSAGALLFPKDLRTRQFDMPGLFGIYKFVIDSNRLGLIARTPSEYEPSSIKLFFFDIKKDSITNYIELGERWGDAGDYMELNSWLFRDSTKQLKTLIWEHQGHDNSVDNPKDTTIETADYYTLLDISKPRIDTIFERKEKLPEQYKQVIKTVRKM
jgi:hypothetical protein